MYKIQNVIIPSKIDETYNMYIREYEGYTKTDDTYFEKYISFDTYFGKILVWLNSSSSFNNCAIYCFSYSFVMITLVY